MDGMTNETGSWGISSVAERFGLDADTLRYYEREGILPAPARDAGGRRVYTASDVELIEMLVHLRATGMPLAQIAEFTGLAARGSGRAERLALLRRHLRSVLEQRDRLDASLDVIGRKIAGYDGGADGRPQLLTGPDCDIAYTIRGTGPLLYLVGAPVGRSGFAPLAEQFADEYTVVTHDPRGIDASVAQPGASEPTPQVLADDLAALARHVGEPATFFGASGGAVTVLELAARRPELVEQVVLHEPPLIRLLHDSALERRADAAFRRALTDPRAGAQEFLDLTGAGHNTSEGERPPAHTPLPEPSPAELERNRYFLGRMAGPSVFYEPSIDAIRSLTLQVCAGELSHGQLARRAARALADALGVPLVDLPGNHLGPSLEAPRFAKALKERLGPAG